MNDKEHIEYLKKQLKASHDAHHTTFKFAVVGWIIIAAICMAVFLVATFN